MKDLRTNSSDGDSKYQTAKPLDENARSSIGGSGPASQCRSSKYIDSILSSSGQPVPAFFVARFSRSLSQQRFSAWGPIESSRCRPHKPRPRHEHRSCEPRNIVLDCSTHARKSRPPCGWEFPRFAATRKAPRQSIRSFLSFAQKEISQEACLRSKKKDRANKKIESANIVPATRPFLESSVPNDLIPEPAFGMVPN